MRPLSKTRNLLVTTEARFTRGADGTLRSLTGGRAYDFWARYLAEFDSVEVLARVDSDAGNTEGFDVEGPSVKVRPIANYAGMRGTLLSIPRLFAQAWAEAAQGGSFILRVPSVIGGVLSLCLALRGKGFALEVVGDPADVFASGVGGRLSKWGGLVTKRLLTWQCQHAIATAYVTRGALQRRYPPGPCAYSTSYSSVDLMPDAIAGAAKRKFHDSARIKVVNVGTMSQRYKGQDILIRTLAAMRGGFPRIDLSLVGDGAFRKEFEQLASDLGVADSVTFYGMIPSGAPVRDILDSSDVYILSSRTEGLPRALIEAMARGLPCIGSDVGGVSELLPDRAMVQADNVRDLVATLKDLLEHPEWRYQLASELLQTARNFESSILLSRRKDFLTAVLSESYNKDGNPR